MHIIARFITYTWISIKMQNIYFLSTWRIIMNYLYMINSLYRDFFSRSIFVWSHSEITVLNCGEKSNRIAKIPVENHETSMLPLGALENIRAHHLFSLKQNKTKHMLYHCSMYRSHIRWIELYPSLYSPPFLFQNSFLQTHMWSISKTSDHTWQLSRRSACTYMESCQDYH